MVPHSSTLAWKIPWMEEPVGCHLWGCTESDTTEATQQQQQEAEAQHRELSSVLCDDLEGGRDRDWEGGSEEKGYTYTND